MASITPSKTPKHLRDSWRTPKEIFNWLNKRFSFDLDAAASPENHLCKSYFSLCGTNALLTHWNEHGRSIFCNPPYSDPAPFIDRAIMASRRGSTVVLLVNASTDAAWYVKAEEAAAEVMLSKGRIAFIDPLTQKPRKGNNSGQAVFVFLPYWDASGITVRRFTPKEIIKNVQAA